MALDKDSSLPLHTQVRNEIRTAIQTNKLKQGERLPSERELVDRYNISRLTVRAALIDLEREGLIYSKPGKGWYVSSSIIDQQLMQLSGFTEDMQNIGVKPSSKLVSQKILVASPEVAEQLQIQAGRTRVFCLKRLRLANETSVAIEEAFLSLDICPDIVDQNFEQASLYEYLHNRDLRPQKALQTLFADIPTHEERQLLNLTGEVAIMRMRRTTYLVNNRPIEYVKSVYRGDRYQFRVALTQGVKTGISGEAVGTMVEEPEQDV